MYYVCVSILTPLFITPSLCPFAGSPSTADVGRADEAVISRDGNAAKDRASGISEDGTYSAVEGTEREGPEICGDGRSTTSGGGGEKCI